MTIRSIASVMLAILLEGVAFAQNAQAPPSVSHEQHLMEQFFPLREASGTSWVPEATPMLGTGLSWHGWHLMLHGNVFGQLLIESAEKHRTGGADGLQASSVNWGMLMARREAAGGRFGVRAMLSAEPWTVKGCGFLNLLASGEICDGDTIHDRQHPHDLFMELAADYDRPLRGALRWQVYAGLAGEPALGPPGFPHRFSAIANPIAPISHHWLDSTHITFGVVTGAVYSQRWKTEVSIFNGREPDDERADLDLGALDSWSARLSFAPSPRWVFQVSSGHLTEAEFEFGNVPRSDLHRSTASATYLRRSGSSGSWATTMAFGLNNGQEILPAGPFATVTQALLVESTLKLEGPHWLFGRGEFVRKPAHDLHAHEFGADIFAVGKAQAGYAYDFARFARFVSGAGASLSASLVPPALAPRYAGRVAWSAALFVSLRPAAH